MNRIRNTIGILLIWFFLFYNIERINEPINIASFVYVYVLICSLAMLFFRPLLRTRFFWLFLISISPYFVLKVWYYQNLLGRSLPLTITEMAAIGLTIFLSRQLAYELVEMRETVTNMIINPLTKGINPFETSQNQINKEIRRARQHQQEVSLLAVRVSEPSLQLNRNRFIRELENEIIQKYINARVGKIFVDQLHITDIVSQRGDQFVILLPQTGKEDTSKIAHRLQSNAQDMLGITIKIGAATFPEEALTFEELMESAEQKMDQVSPESKKLPVIQESEMDKAIVIEDSPLSQIQSSSDFQQGKD
jgi:GGDEF domain-containing protein